MVRVYPTSWKIVPGLKEIETTWNEEETKKSSGMQRAEAIICQPDFRYIQNNRDEGGNE